MASDEIISQFTEICGCSDRIAKQYLQLADDNIEQATMLFFENGGVDLNPTQTGPAAPASRPNRGEVTHGAASIDDDDDNDHDDDDDDDVQIIENPHYESDEAMARRLQEEMYGGRGSGSRGNGAAGAGAGVGADIDDVRAPMARTTETLVGPDYSDMGYGMPTSTLGRARRGPAGVFTQQRQSSSIWNAEDPENISSSSTTRPARNGRPSASTTPTGPGSAKLNRLAEMYKPPFDIMSDLPWDALREEARSIPKWIMINIQDPSIFDCQILNRDLFKDEGIKETIKQSFIFAQYTVDDPRAQTYLNYYFQNYESQDAFPYIAIVDPRTGEQVKRWSGRPVPERSEFLIQVHEFLDRYSLSVWAKNPVPVQRKNDDKKRKTVKDLDKMTEEEMLEMAMRESMGEQVREKSVDPDELTKDNDKGKQREGIEIENEDDNEVEMTDDLVPESAPETESPEHGLFISIPTPPSPIAEPPLGPTVTRIQFRHPSGRVIRRFSLQDPVRRIYEWMKAEPLSEEMKGKEFECVCLGKNLIWALDDTVETAGLKNGTVMVGWVGDEEEEED